MARGTGGARWRDNDTAYGWVSIILHWVVAVGVLTIWLIGDWMQGRSAESPGDLLQLHVSLAASLWLLAVVRIAWRLRSRHPRIGNPGPWRHLGIKLFHYLLLLALAVMLVSGPLMVWSWRRGRGHLWLVEPAQSHGVRGLAEPGCAEGSFPVLGPGDRNGIAAYLWRLQTPDV